ncbi:hypothetical protein LshimejAT787_0404290 [Lyophyllum shimeji]|uniref:F-box domain-containing protein n=1 Tax=Lyophyllum shimeji TaxID=47721 RepID=A0A9P3PK33_LYOSH|nr:hypothetical protein LshimejAT787_0404290 [Lyophyllum shimeji]
MVDPGIEPQHPAAMVQDASLLLSLSTELLLLILEYLPNAALLAISKTSQRLHCFALPAYLSRHGISNSQPTSLILHGKTIDALPGLRASLSITSLDSISCKFEGPDEARFARDVTNLLRFIHKLTRVNCVTLHMGSIDARWVYGFATAKSDAWKPTFLRLLDTILERHCSSLTVTHGYFVLPMSPKGGLAWHHQLVGTSESVAAARSTFLGYSFAARRQRPSIERRLSSTELKSFSIHSNMLLVQPFCDWTLRTLNSCDIRSLSVSFWGISQDTWASILPTITLPSLVEFTAGTTDIAFPDLIEFLSRHPSIHTLNLHPHFGYPGSQKRPRRSKHKRLLPQLTALGGSPSNITTLLSQLHPPPQLYTIALSLPMHQRVFQLSDFEQLNQHIAHVTHDITVPTVLKLEFTVPYETSAAQPPIEEGDRGIAAVFRGVQTLSFSSDGTFAFEKWVVSVLPAWLTNFVALRHVRFAQVCAPAEVDARQRLVTAITARCPGVQTVTVGDHIQSFR